ncbi:MAG: hypothetical protein OEU36_18160 [Gammaproteobacteria bacterium]|nr:hypothetical protein [Gammaproteobacteria bacterium]
MNAQPLSLTVPKLSAKQPRSVKVRLSRVEQWLEELTNEDHEESAQQLHRSLYAQNRLELPPHLRVRMLELYREQVGKVVEVLRESFATKPLPLSLADHDAAVLVQNLTNELANGYKIVVNNFIDRGANSSADKLTQGRLRQALQRAVYQLGQVLLSIYQAHIATPKGLWRELNQLYWYASANDQADQSIRTPGCGTPDGMMTLTESYQQVVLLGTCHPYSLHPDDCMRVYRSISGWQHEAEITRQLQFSIPAGRFLINLAADSPAIPLVKIGNIEPGEYLRVLNAVGILRKLRSVIKNWEQSTDRDSIRTENQAEANTHDGRIELLHRVGRTWSGASVTRRSNRTPSQISVSVCIGIDAICYFLNNEQPFSPDGPTIQETDRIPPNLVEGTVSEHDLHSIYHCETRDESANGFRIAVTDDEHMQLQVGDLIGLEHPSWESWLVCVVRWIQCDDQTALTFGAELVTPQASPVSVRRIGSDVNDNVPYLPALLLPAIRSLQQDESLIVARGTYRPPNKFEVVDSMHGSRSILPTILMEKTASYERVAFSSSS